MSKEARKKSRELRQAQAAAAKLRRKKMSWITGVAGVVIAGLVIAIIAVVVDAVNDDVDTPRANPSGPLVNPKNITSDGAIPVGQDGAPVTVEIYLDYMCPACGQFEQANTAELDRLVQSGTARLALRPIAFLDEQSEGTRYSTRAANAMATVVDGAPEQVRPFHEALFREQPEEGTRGLSDNRIAELAKEAGVPQEVVDRFTALTFEPWVAKSTETAFNSGVSGTPTIKINGQVFQGDPYSTGPLTQAIEAAAAGAR